MASISWGVEGSCGANTTQAEVCVVLSAWLQNLTEKSTSLKGGGGMKEIWEGKTKKEIEEQMSKW